MLHLSRLWSVFETVADCHTLACTYEFRQIGVECVVREGCRLQRFPFPVHMRAVGGLCDAEDFGCLDCIFIVALVEVACTEQQENIRMLILRLSPLLVELALGFGDILLLRVWNGISAQ